MQPAPLLPLDFCSPCYRARRFGLQMHEELLKVTNELYTVSLTLGSATICDWSPFASMPSTEGRADQWSGVTLGPFALSFAQVTAGLSGWG